MARARQIERIIAKGQLVPLLFSQAALAINQSAVAITVVETSADTIEYVIPWEYEVVGISASVSEARTAGTATVDATIDTTATGLQAVIDGTNTLRDTGTQARGTDVGAAGSRVGVKLTTDGTWAPTTADISVVVWVIVHLSGV